jgi:hypothetical protein
MHQEADMRNTFILGVGAQKSGTTWIDAYLRASGRADFGILKEYHIWDARYVNLCQQFVITEKSLSAHKLKPNLEKMQLRYAMQNVDGLYEAYFNSLCVNGIAITGDITPTYAFLSVSNLKEIKQKLELVGFNVKALFLMRDPVERCWSAIRMGRKHRLAKGDRIDSRISEHEHLKMAFRTPQFWGRTDYPTVVENLKTVFNEENIYFGIYEDMFEKKNVSKISSFLDIPPNYEFAQERTNVSPKVESLDPTLRQEIRKFYDHVYEYCGEHFPQTRHLWS